MDFKCYVDRFGRAELHMVPSIFQVKMVHGFDSVDVDSRPLLVCHGK